MNLCSKASTASRLYSNQAHASSGMDASCRTPPYSRELPPITTVQTLTESRHWFISRPRLRLRIADLLLTALATPQRIRHTLNLLRHHCLVHIILRQFLLFCSLLCRLELFEGHGHELIGRNAACEDARA